MYNLICAMGFIFVIVLSKLIQKSSKKELLIKYISCAILLYKSCHYIIENLKGNICVPVEISAISYFLVTIIVIFKIKSLYSVGAFYGIVAGLGFFSFYLILGFKFQNSISLSKFVVACICHGYLLLTGLHLFQNHSFNQNEKNKIWITIFAMLGWALLFYNIPVSGTTFVSFIIKPEFLFVFNQTILNLTMLALYYALLVFAFWNIVNIFFKLNKRQVYSTNNQENKTHL